MKEKIISESLRKIGIPRQYSGFSYLAEAIVMVTDNFSLIHKGLTYKVYFAVAKEFDTTPSRVERAIRHALIAAWEKEDKTALAEVLAPLAVPERKMTNAEFIATMAEAVRFQLMEKAS